MDKKKRKTKRRATKGKGKAKKGHEILHGKKEDASWKGMGINEVLHAIVNTTRANGTVMLDYGVDAEASVIRKAHESPIPSSEPTALDFNGNIKNEVLQPITNAACANGTIMYDCGAGTGAGTMRMACGYPIPS